MENPVTPVTPTQEPMTTPVPTTPTEVTPVVSTPLQPALVAPAPSTTTPEPANSTLAPLSSTPSDYKSLPEKATSNKKTLMLIITLLILVAAIAVAAFLILSKSPAKDDGIFLEPLIRTPTSSPVVSTPVKSDTGLTPEEQMNEGNPQPTTGSFAGKVYDVNFDFDNILGTASSTTLRKSFSITPNFDTDCKSETIKFSNDNAIGITIYTGHCEGAFGGTGSTQTLTSKDGKIFNVTSILLDNGTYTIRGLQSMDGINTYGSGLQGMQIEVYGISTADLQKYQVIVKDIVSSAALELSPLKSTDFDKVE